MSETEGQAGVRGQGSGVKIPPRSAKQETRQQTGAFSYLGYHFIPVGISANSATAEGQNRIRMMEWEAEPFHSVSAGLYSKKSFLEFSGSEADVYYCVEHGRYYMPGERKLFEYKGQFQRLPGKRPVEDKKSKETPDSGKDVFSQDEKIQNRNQEGRKETRQVLSRKRWE